MSVPVEMPTALVSVVIPVHNVGAFVGECLESVAAQTYSNLQIVVVDDGSTDDSPRVCAEFAAREPRAAVITQANRGLSGARNAGLDRVHGDFVVLLDGDDLLAPTFVESLLTDAVTYAADVVVTGLAPFETELPTWDRPGAVQVWRTPQEVDSLVTGPKARFEGPTKLYRAKLFEGLRFHEGILYEDLELIVRLLPRLRAVVLRSDHLYGYRQRPGSIMARTRGQISPDLITVLRRNLAYAEAHLDPARAQRLRTAFVLHAGRSLEYLDSGEPWRNSAAYRRAYRGFIRQNALGIARDDTIAAPYRGLLLASGLSTKVFKVAFGAARRVKQTVRPNLRRAAAGPRLGTSNASAAVPDATGAAVTFIYRGQLDIERSRIAFLLEATCAAFGRVDLIHLSPGLGSDETALRRFTAAYPTVRSVRAIPASMRGLRQSRRDVRRALAPDARAVIAVGFTAGAFVPGRIAVWCVNGIPEERLLTRGDRASRAIVRLSWQLARRVRADGLVVVSEPMAALARARLRPATIVVVPNTVDTQDFRLDEATVPRYLTYQGGGAPWQGLDRLAEVWGALSARDPELRFRIISRDPRTQVLASRLSPDVVESVSSDDPRQVGTWLSEARLGFVYRAPNLVNKVAWPMKFAEYLAAGAPVVITECGWGLEDVVARHDVGVVVPWDAHAAEAARGILGYLSRIGTTRPPGLQEAVAELEGSAWTPVLAARLREIVERSAR